MTVPAVSSADTAGRAPVLLVIGAGPGIGSAVARRFAREGYDIGVLARDLDRLVPLAAELQRFGVRAAAAAADIRRPDQLHDAMHELQMQLGPAEVMCFSPLPDVRLIKPVLETGPDALLSSLELNVIGAAAATAAVLPAMTRRGTGTLLFTTGSAALAPSPDRAASAVTTTAAATYLQLLHQALVPRGITVAHTTIVGPVGPGRQHEPDDVAAHLYRCHTGSRGGASVLR